MQANQQVTFLTDGADDVRDLPLYLNPQAEHLLDWFHVTMRITVMGQMAKASSLSSPHRPHLAADVAEQMECIKWFLWHGNVFRALQTVGDLEPAELRVATVVDDCEERHVPRRHQFDQPGDCVGDRSRAGLGDDLIAGDRRESDMAGLLSVVERHLDHARGRRRARGVRTRRALARTVLGALLRWSMAPFAARLLG